MSLVILPARSLTHTSGQMMRRSTQHIHRVNPIFLFRPVSVVGSQCQELPVLQRHQQPTSSFSTKRDTYASDIEDESDSRSSLHPERSEYSQSGTDNAVAAQAASWDIRYETPEKVREASWREAQSTEKKVCPLEVSPANQEVSRFTDESGRNSSVVHGPSKRVSPKKGRKVDYGGAVVSEGGNG
ncbi:hypothetical protein VTO42DRAFT_8141 [Malbranchea cinnamomea]